MAIIEAFLQILTLGCVVVFALNYRKRPPFLGPLGIYIIALSCITFFIQVAAFAFTKYGTERVVLLSAGLIGTPLIALYWIAVWNRMRPDKKVKK